MVLFSLFRQTIWEKNIFIKGDIDPEKISKIKGVNEVNKEASLYEVKISDDSVVDDVFKSISKCSITRFEVAEPSLNEIFVEKVGESYEK